MYEVVASWDDVWIARVPSVPGCHTYGRSLAQARERMREALRLWTGEPEPVVDVRINAPDWAEDDVDALEAAREEYRRARADLDTCLERAARSIIDSGVSVRDAAVILGMSHQRISQILGRQ